jgi:hypothetical protein
MGRPRGALRTEIDMNRSEIEAILREHLGGIHEELGSLFRGIEVSLDNHLARTEAAVAEARSKEADTTALRSAALEEGR